MDEIAEFEAVRRMQSFFDSDTFSDLTVQFSGREIKIHKVIACIHPKWFANAFQGNFVERSQSCLQLHDDDAQGVQGMLRHFYSLDPLSTCATGTTTSTSKLAELPAKLKHIVSVYTVADKYDVPVLKADMLKTFTFLASTYWLALCTSGALPDIIAAIFVLPSRTDGLRKAAVALCLKHIKQLRAIDAAAFEALMDAIPDFAAAMLMQVPLPSPRLLRWYVPYTYLQVKDARDKDSQVELHKAAKLGDVCECRALVRKGKYVNTPDESTPLHFAAVYGHMPVVRFLVENARATVDARCDSRTFPTPLAWARYAGHHDVVEYLALSGGLEA